MKAQKKNVCVNYNVSKSNAIAVSVKYIFFNYINYIADYGDEEVKSIKQHFSSVLKHDLDDAELLNEWSLLKTLVYEK